MWSIDTHSAAPSPSCDRLARTLVHVGQLLGTDECFWFGGRFHFSIRSGWSIAISPESGSRFRIEACHWSRPRSTLWSLDGEDDHLAGIVLELAVAIGSGDAILERDRLS